MMMITTNWGPSIW